MTANPQSPPVEVLSVAEQIALEGYRAALSFVSADSWDGCDDCIEILKAASGTDIWRPAWTADETARALSDLRSRYSGGYSTEGQFPAPVEVLRLLPGLDHIASFINALDSEGMSAKDVRTAIYTECLEPRHRLAAQPPAPLTLPGESEATENGYSYSAQGLDEATLTNGRYKPDDMGPIGDAARRIASWAEGPARGNIYKAAKRELAAILAHRPGADEAGMRDA